MNYGVVVSCPGSSLLESDLNYWRNRNIDAIGEDIEESVALVRKYFEYAAGELTRVELEKEIEASKSKSWYTLVGISDPDIDGRQIDTKLLFSPVPHFEKTKQPVLIVQGTMDEIIPSNSIDIIEQALKQAKNPNYETVLLESASHSMHFVGESDFPYMPKLHPDYLKTIEDWINTVSNTK